MRLIGGKMRPGRCCAICGGQGSVWGYANALRFLGFKGSHAHTECLSKEKAKSVRLEAGRNSLHAK